MLELYRDDGPLARALGAARPRGCRRRRCSCAAGVAAARSPRWRSTATAPRTPRAVGRASRWLAASRAACRAARAATGRLRWAVPPLLRARRVRGRCSGSARSPALVAAGGVRAARRARLRHYDLVYRPAPPRRARRRRGSASPRGLGRPARRSAACCSSPARCRPGSTSLAAILGGAVRRRRDPRLVAGSERAVTCRRRRGGRGRMIGMVLAAGAGQRLGSLTDDLPKTLLAVDGERTILDIALGQPRARSGSRRRWSSPASPPSASTSASTALADRHGLRARARSSTRRRSEWNNAYSLWCARDALRRGRAAGQRRHRAPGLASRSALLAGARRRRPRASRSTRPSRSARRR